MRSFRVFLVVVVATVATHVLLTSVTTRAQVLPATLDPEAARWVEETLAEMSVDEKVGQLLMPSFFSVYTSSDSEVYDSLVELVEDYHVGGLLVFGARRPRPDVLLNPTYARNALGQPLSAASLLNRLQSIASVPLLVTADFETGLGFRMNGGTTFPRAMAFGAAGDQTLAYQAGRITAEEARAVGVHMNLAPVVDVNNNPRNPVINTRSFGEDPTQVGELAAAYIEGLQTGGLLATLKHFPGHGDTDIDSHRGLPLITHSRERIDSVELLPFRAGIEAGVDAVMTAHIVWPALEPAEPQPATFSAAIVGDLLRRVLAFDGLVVTDSMRMRAVTDLLSPGEAAVRAVLAGHDVVLHSPDDRRAFRGIKAAVERGDIDEARLDASVDRILTAKARLGLHRSSRVSLDTLPTAVGTRANLEVARTVSERSVTLLKDVGGQIPLALPPTSNVLYLSVLDRPSGWGLTTPSSAVIPELRRHWEHVTAIELSDRTPASEIELVRETAGQYDAIVVGVFVRTAARGGRPDLSPPLIAFLRGLSRDAATAAQPFVTVLFGSPYVVTLLEELPTLLATYDLTDVAERSAVLALIGARPITGVLPISLGSNFPLGHGLVRETRSAP